MSERFSRQSFLGVNSEAVIADVLVGVVGLGGGGSHIVQQLAHLGFRNYVLFDGDKVEESNLNRLVAATRKDADEGTPKLDVAERLIRSLEPAATIDGFKSRWQEHPEALRRCDVVLGGVDRFDERSQLEAACRRHLIPLVDIGLDVVHPPGGTPLMGGQVILSMPGSPCMRCLGFITEANLAKEASQYGDAGLRPQVVFANGQLASAAVGIVVDLFTDWTKKLRGVVYLEYRGNENVLRPHPRLMDRGIPSLCPHYPANEVGAPVYRPL